MPTKDQIEKAWKNAKPVRGEDPNKVRQDPYGNKISKSSYGKDTARGWEVDHIKPSSRGGSDATQNLQALKTSVNREKGDSLVKKVGTISSCHITNKSIKDSANAETIIQGVNCMRNITIILIFLSIAGCGEVMNNEAKTFEQAKPLIDAGWLPKWFPETSTNIREAHDIDTNAVVASFNVNDESWVPSKCERIGPFEAPAPSLNIGWWPGDVPASQLATYRHIFYKCSSNSYIAITPDRSEANYWLNSP